MIKLHLSGLHKFFWLLAALALSAGAYADDIQVEGAWARAVPGRDSANVFMFITSKQDATLVGASSPASKTVDMRTMEHKGSMMRTLSVESVKLPAGKRVDMTSIHGYHLALTGLSAPLKDEGTVPVTLEIETSGKRVKIDVQAEIRPAKKAMQR